MTHILQKLRDDVAGMRAKGSGPAAEIWNAAIFNVEIKIDAAIADQPEPDELVARLMDDHRSMCSLARLDPAKAMTAGRQAADLITSQQAEIRALTAERDAARLRGMIDCETICDDGARQFSEGPMTESKAFAGSAVRVVRRRIREAAAALTRKDKA